MPRTHRTNELRSIAAHRLIVERLHAEPEVLTRARERVEGWLEAGRPVDPRYARAWQALLARPVPEIAAALVEDSERMRDLRQVGPFAGAITPAQWWRIVREVHEDSEVRPAAG